GDMHIGNLRVAIFNYILAKQKNEKFLLRIEDTDIARNIKDKDKDIMSLLTLFGIQWDNLVYQSHHFSRHQQLAQHLIDQGKAFYCYCTKEFLEEKRAEAKAKHQAFRYDDSWASLHQNINKNPVVRIKNPKKTMAFRDIIKGDIEFSPNEMESFVILKENKIPTYNFACAIDDMLYDIDFIIRGEDHVSNTPKQMLVHEYLNYSKNISFAHLPILLNEEGRKMSKRDNASSVQWLLNEGFLPQAISNYLILIGNKTPCEIFTLKDCIPWFDLTNISKAPAKFDLDKLRFINREHFKRLSEQELALLLGYKDPRIGALGKIYIQESSTLNEMRTKIDRIFFKKSLLLDQSNVVEFQPEIEILQDTLLSMIQTTNLAQKSYEEFKQEAMQHSNLKGKRFFKSLRFLLTGHDNGPEISDLFPILQPFLQDILRK
ncbi:MAG: glutamate--tRNA ligase, partial [Helicobacter sp.]|nr:glutamate--tRNA ligase [Helicobacter sp.]